MTEQNDSDVESVVNLEETLPMKATQQILGKACKRMRLSCNGAKAVLVERLSKVGVTTKEEVGQLAHKFDTDGQIAPAESSVASTVRTRQPTWTPHEMARLAHVLEDPRNFVAFQRLQKKPESRAEIEERHDPWSVEFVQSFNSDEFLPERPQPYDGVTQQLLDSFDPNDHPYERTAEALRSKWANLRSRFTICSRNYEKSGQGESDVFPDFARGDPIISYLHCVFKNSPTLDLVVREVGAGNRAESEIDGSSWSDRTSLIPNTHSQSNAKKRKGISDAGLEKIADSLSKPIEIKLSMVTENNSEDEIRNEKRQKVVSNDLLRSLMDLERDLVRRSDEATTEGDTDFFIVLQNRLRRVRTRIDNVLDE